MQQALDATSALPLGQVAADEAVGAPLAAPTRTFLNAVLVATAIPLAIGPLAVHLRSSGALEIAATAHLVAFLAAVGNSHICLTSFFYLDPHARQVLGRHRRRFLAAPLLALLAVPALHVLLGVAHLNYLNLAFTAWLLWHFSRQNWGVLCFTARATGAAAPAPPEAWVIRLSAIAAILGVGYRFTEGTVLAGWEDYLYQVGLGLMVAAQGALVWTLLRDRTLRTSGYRVAVLLLSAAFFLPVFVTRNWALGVAGFGAAHAAQYFVFMYFIGASDAGERRHGRFLTLVGAYLATLAVLWTVQDAALWGETSFIYGLAMAMTVAHFIVDAGIWRLGLADQRRYVALEFPFIFATESPAAAPGATAQ